MSDADSYKFDIQKDMELSDEEKENLKQIKKYDQYQWLVEVAIQKTG